MGGQYAVFDNVQTKSTRDYWVPNKYRAFIKGSRISKLSVVLINSQFEHSIGYSKEWIESIRCYNSKTVVPNTDRFESDNNTYNIYLDYAPHVEAGPNSVYIESQFTTAPVAEDSHDCIIR